MIDIERVRADTAGCEAVAHLNNAGSSLPPKPVVDAVVDYLRAEELAGGYEIAGERAADLAQVYGATAAYLGCSPQEVAVTVSAADSWWRAFSSIPLAAGDRVLVSHSEYQGNAFGWLQARDRGVIVDVLPNGPTGEIDVTALAALLDERVKVVSVTMVAMTNGCIQPVAAIGDVIKDSSALYLLDACQAAGQLPLNVDEIGCDFLAYTGRKFMRGPRGTGVLYARDSAIEQLGVTPFIDGRSASWTSPTSFEYAPHAQRFEFGEHGYATKVGLGVATKYMLELGLDDINDRVDTLSASLRDQLAAIERVTVRDDGLNKCGIVTFTIDGIDLGQAQAALQAQGLNLSAPAVGMAQLELGPRSIPQVLRAGVHYYNTQAELDRLCAAVIELT